MRTLLQPPRAWLTTCPWRRSNTEKLPTRHVLMGQWRVLAVTLLLHGHVVSHALGGWSSVRI
jgi:hypothetical protein